MPMNTTVCYMNAPTATTKTAISGIWSHTDANIVILLTIRAAPADRDLSITLNLEGIKRIPTSAKVRKEVVPQNTNWHYLWKL